VLVSLELIGNIQVRFDMVIHSANRFRLIFLGIGLLVLACGCTVNPPVQEMSNARQTIQAAKDVQADTYSPSHLTQAQDLMTKATGALEKGDYISARDFAVDAQKLAIKARMEALTQQQRN